MTEAWDSAIASVGAAVRSVVDPRERFKAMKDSEAKYASEMREVQREIALELREQKLTYRQIGEVMGGVTAQRAEQVAKGR